MYQQKIEALKNWQADVVLGLFPVADAAQAAKCDVVDWDENKNVINEIVIKSKVTTLRICWLTAVWSPTFTAFMHSYLQSDLNARKAQPTLPELFLGNVLQAALKAGLNIKGIYFEKEAYIDIGTPDDFMKAQQGYLTSW